MAAAGADSYDALYAHHAVLGAALSTLGARVERSVVRAGRELSVIECGDADAHTLLALFHGSMATWRQSSALLAAAKAAGMRVVAFDTLGCGESSRPRGGAAYASQELYEDAVRVVEQRRGAARQVVVVGHRFGCQVALATAVQLKPASAVLVCPDDLPGAAVSSARALFRWLPLFALRMLRSSLSNGFADAAIFNEGDKDGSLRKLCLAHNRRDDLRVCQGFYGHYKPITEAHAADAVAACGRILVVSGEEDKVIPPSSARALVSRLREMGADVLHESMEGAAHLPMIEQPEALQRAILDFVRKA